MNLQRSVVDSDDLFLKLDHGFLQLINVSRKTLKLLKNK